MHESRGGARPSNLVRLPDTGVVPVVTANTVPVVTANTAYTAMTAVTAMTTAVDGIIVLCFPGIHKQ